MIRSFQFFWKNSRLKIALSTICIIVALIDTFIEALSPIAAGALAFAIVPWVLDYIEKISAPGGFGIVFTKAKNQLDQSDVVVAQEDAEVFTNYVSDDPNLSIALMRVEIERKLRRLSKFLPPDEKRNSRSLTTLTKSLKEAGIISDEASSLISDLAPVMNEAVHGITLQEDASDFAKEYGPKVLALLGSSVGGGGHD